MSEFSGGLLEHKLVDEVVAGEAERHMGAELTAAEEPQAVLLEHAEGLPKTARSSAGSASD
jgi:hypothetical protein